MKDEYLNIMYFFVIASVLSRIAHSVGVSYDIIYSFPIGILCGLVIVSIKNKYYNVRLMKTRSEIKKELEKLYAEFKDSVPDQRDVGFAEGLEWVLNEE